MPHYLVFLPINFRRRAILFIHIGLLELEISVGIHNKKIGGFTNKIHPAYIYAAFCRNRCKFSFAIGEPKAHLQLLKLANAATPQVGYLLRKA